jgi:hypothetical protein
MIDFTEGGKPAQVRMLSYMVTGCVVWYDIENRSVQHVPKRVPIQSPEVDYVTYEGMLNVSQFQTHFKDYSLNYTLGSPNPFSVVPLAPEYQELMKLTRAKAYAISRLNNFVIRNLERNGVVNHPLLDSTVDIEKIIPIYQEKMNLNYDLARKLIEFNMNEHRINIESIKYLQIEGELAIGLAKTVDDVIYQFNKISSQLGILGLPDGMILKYL